MKTAYNFAYVQTETFTFTFTQQAIIVYIYVPTSKISWHLLNLATCLAAI